MNGATEMSNINDGGPACDLCMGVDSSEVAYYGGCRCCGRLYDADVAEFWDAQLRKTSRTLGTMIVDMFRALARQRQSWERHNGNR